MKRRLFNLVAAVSLVVCLATVGLWVRSYWIVDHFSYSRPDCAVFIESGGGQFRFEHVRATPWRDYVGFSGFSHHADKADGPLRSGMMMPGSRAHVDRWGFWIVTGERWGDHHYALFMPAWCVTLLLLVAPAGWAAVRCRAAVGPNGEGLCPTCGYDLRATPDRCPECGREVTTTPAATV